MWGEKLPLLKGGFMTFKWEIIRFEDKEIIGSVTGIDEARELLKGLNSKGVWQKMKLKKYGNIYNNYLGIRINFGEWLKRNWRIK